MSKIMCCYIKSHDGRKCEKEAEFEIIYGNAPHEVTESCASHIGEIVDDDIGRFEVLRLVKEEDCPVCHGKGSTTDHHDPCSNCDGKGYIK